MDVATTELTDIAAGQEGLLSVDNLTEAGNTIQQRRWQMNCGSLKPVAPRVYRIAESPDTHRQRLRIGLL
ncbi:MAG: hypothetical protein ACI8V4_002310, partial [Ilumatobacter sp.]